MSKHGHAVFSGMILLALVISDFPATIKKKAKHERKQLKLDFASGDMLQKTSFRAQSTVQTEASSAPLVIFTIHKSSSVSPYSLFINVCV